MSVPVLSPGLPADPAPLPVVVEALTRFSTYAAVYANLPDVELLG